MLDTRDLYKRQCELQEELDTLTEEFEDAKEEMRDNCDDLRKEYCDCEYCIEAHSKYKDLLEWKEDYLEELQELNDLEDEVGNEWMHGEVLIPEDEFTDYAKQFADDIYNIETRCPYNHIDWESAADELRMDYSETEFQGETYLFRAS